jgi:hypothetical protein
MIVFVFILACAALFFLFRSLKRTADNMILRHALHENEIAKEKIQKEFINKNLNLAYRFYQEERGKYKHHLQLAKISYDDIEMLLNDFEIWYSAIKRN